MSAYAAMGGGGGAVCDLRSDTFTRPDAAMLEAMATADLGDDCYGEDPTVNALEGELAAMLGKESAIFMPTGTQSNLVAILSHCGRGEEVIVGDTYHIRSSEASGASVLGGVALAPVVVGAGAEIAPHTVTAEIRDDDPHYAVSRLLCLENTVGGQVIALAEMHAAADAARAHGLSVHLDGARFFNAVMALDCAPQALASVADSVSVCLSKGLGTPAGSVLVADKATVAKARRWRKMLGGGMRQSGVLAAAGRHALAHNIPALAEDHRRAALLGDALGSLDLGAVRVATNMVFLTPRPEDHAPLCEHMTAQGVRIGGGVPEIRMVLHRDVDDTALDRAIEAFGSYARRLRAA